MIRTTRPVIGDSAGAVVGSVVPSAVAVSTAAGSEQVLGPVEATGGRWLNRHRYLILSVVTAIGVAIQTANGQWSTDMWQHVAVVRELIARPVDPTHPLVRAATTHPNYSPYTVALGLFGHVTGLGAVAVLSVAAVPNVILLVVALRLFVIEITDNRRAPFWALLFMLLLWGFEPLRASGVFGLNSIGFGAPYPSAFAAPIALLTLTAALRACRDPRWGWFVGLCAGLALTMIVHPITGTWLSASLVVVAACRARGRQVWIGLAAAGIVAVGLCLAWPYYSVLSLVTQGGSYDTSNAGIYHLILVRIFPMLLGLPFLWRRWRADRLDPLSLLLVTGTVLYLGGWVTDHQTYGRAISLVVLALAVGAADGVGRLEVGFRWAEAGTALRAGAVGLAALLVLGVATTSPGWIRMVPSPLLPSSVRNSSSYARKDDAYRFLSRYVDGRQVVVGTTTTDDQLIPATAGRALVPGYPQVFLDDVPARRPPRSRYLDPTTSAGERRAIEARYDLRFVLLHPSSSRDQALAHILESEGATTVYDHHDMQLLRLPTTPG